MTRPSRRHLLASGLAALGAASVPPFAAARAVSDDDASADGLPGRTPHTRFALNLEMWYGALPFGERIERAAALGFPAVEFWPWQGKDLDDIGRRCREHGLAVGQFTAWGFRPGLNDPANHTAFVEAIKQGCDVAHRLGAEVMTVVGGDDQPGMTQAEMHAHIVDGLRLAAPVAEDAGVTLALEPMNIRVDHKGHCLYGSPPALAICRAVASPRVKIMWDLYHMQVSEGDLCGRLRDGFDQIAYVQLADTPGRHEPGTGEIHYPRVLRQLFELGYRGFVGLECSPSVPEDEAAHRVALADRW
ncbi:MAG: TIM barrel protein [Planctomycetes bacterium]|nr:TIM barrel protein [Planctomycetota bacterium]